MSPIAQGLRSPGSHGTEASRPERLVEGGRERLRRGRSWSRGLSSAPHNFPASPAPGRSCPWALLASALLYQVAQSLQELQGQLQELQAAWVLRQQRCEESQSLLELRQGLEQAEAWLASRESLLLQTSFGVSEGPPGTGVIRQPQPRVDHSLAAQPGLWGLREGPENPGPHPDLPLLVLSVGCGEAAPQT